jgi:hypothetical protein
MLLGVGRRLFCLLGVQNCRLPWLIDGVVRRWETKTLEMDCDFGWYLRSGRQIWHAEPNRWAESRRYPPPQEPEVG